MTRRPFGDTFAADITDQLDLSTPMELTGDDYALRIGDHVVILTAAQGSVRVEPAPAGDPEPEPTSGTSLTFDVPESIVVAEIADRLPLSVYAELLGALSITDPNRYAVRNGPTGRHEIIRLPGSVELAE